MKNKTSTLISITLIFTIFSCNESNNQILNQKTTLEQTDSNGPKLKEDLVDTFDLPIKIDIEKYRNLGFQIFENENFILKNKYLFELDNSFDGDKSTFPYNTYAAYKNKGDFENGIILKIKIDNITADYKNIERKDYPENSKSFMDSYRKNLLDYKIEHKSTIVDNEETIIYNMEHQDSNIGSIIKQSAAFFVHERKSYYVQITSSKNQEKLLKSILNNIKFIK